VSLKITGAVVELLEEQSGTGKNGPWRKQDFILETEGQYANKVCITQWGDNIEKFALKVQDKVTVHIDIQSREYNGRWYTDVKAWRIERDGADGGGDGSTGAGPGAPGAGSPPPPGDESYDEDDLPF
jgi:hypothetical protein